MIDWLVCLCLPFLTGGSLGPASQSESFSNIDNQFFWNSQQGFGFWSHLQTGSILSTDAIDTSCCQ